MTFRFLSAARTLLDTAAARSALVAGLAFAACPAAYADKNKAPPPPRAAPQVNRPAPQAAGGRPSGGAMSQQGGVHIPGQQAGVHIPGQQAGVHIPGQQAAMRVPGQQASGAGYGGATGGRPAGSPTLHLPSSVRPPASNGNALVHPVVAQARPAPVRSANRPEASPAHPAGAAGKPVGGKTGEGKQGGSKPEGGKAARSEAAARAGTMRLGETSARDGTERPRGTLPQGAPRPDHPAPVLAMHPSRENLLPVGRRGDTYPIHDAAAERATLQGRTHDFHARDVAAFSGAERARWSHGAWSDGWHYGRHGWWWQVDGVWYPYAVPIYPYPEVVDAPAVYDGYVRDDGSVAPGAPDAQIPPEVARLGSPLKGDDALSIGRLPAAQLVASHCDNPEGDYPDVRRCAQPWVTR